MQEAQPEPAVQCDEAGNVSPDAQALPSPGVADGIEHVLPPAALTLLRIQWWILTVILGVCSLVGIAILVLVLGRWWAIAPLLLGWTAFVCCLATASHFGTGLAFRYARYRVDANGIHVRRGMLWRAVVSVPRSRVQHTDVSQGPLARRFGLGTLQIYTAGTQHSQVSIEGLDHAVALAIRDHLIASVEDRAV